MQNVEAKFPLSNIAAAKVRAEAIGFTYVGTLVQHDTFFIVSNGNLKLREQPDDACLIYYQRHHDQGLELSNYEIVRVTNPAKMRAILSAALGLRGEIRKRRVLLRRDNIRLHLDEVVNRGVFGELEAVMATGDDPADSRAQISAILATLRIPSDQLIGVSYFELPA